MDKLPRSGINAQSSRGVTMYSLEIYRNKKYRTMYTGKLSQCFKRLQSVYSRARIRHNNNVLYKINQ